MIRLPDTVIYTYGWREAFLFVGAGVFVLIILAAQFLVRDPSKIGQVPYGEESSRTGKVPDYTSGLSVKQALHARKFWILAFVIFCNGFCSVTALVHIVHSKTGESHRLQQIYPL